MNQLQNTILELIAKGETLIATMGRLCHEVERVIPDIVCSVLAIDAQAKLHPLATKGLPLAYTDLIDGVAIGPDVGTCGTAAYLGTEVATHDLANDAHWEGFCDLLLPLGIKACWSRPIMGPDDRVIATFALYYFENRGPSQIERTMVDHCVNLCAIAFDRERRVRDYERRAYTDTLTGLANRAAFNARLTELDCSVPGAWALCLIDLDNLKVVNDTFGHHSGDVLITHVAARIATAAAPSTVFRVGGDEFAIIVRDPAELSDLDHTMSDYLAALAPVAECGGNLVVPRATIGFAVVSHGDRLPERVRQNADFALYHAKETRRGGYARYWPGIGTRMTRRLTAIREVDSALRDGRIETFYQPIMLMRTGEIVGVEALCRMRIGENYISAGSFHEATFDAGIAIPLTERVVSQVARDVRDWLDMGIAFQHVGINVTSADFHSGTIYSLLARTFEQAGVPLKHVILEVTESVYMDDDAGVVRKAMAELREKGLKIALDDFGTGYASLTHLMSVPVDIIKIDKSFVDNIVTQAASAAIVEGIIGIARNLGIKVVAEGIESVEQAERLLDLGCALGQGYLYSKAVNARETADLLLQLGQDSGYPQVARVVSGT